MLLKRSLVLAAGVLLFIVIFIIYFAVARGQMENRFRDERVQFGVEGTRLTTLELGGSAPETPSPSAPASPAPAPAPAPSDSPATPDAAAIPAPSSPATPAPAIDNAPPTAAPATNTTPDTNIIIGPLPPPPTSPAPDPNATPMPPSSTYNDEKESGASIFQLAAYHPGLLAQSPTVEPSQSSTISTPAPVSATPPTTTNAGAPPAVSPIFANVGTPPAASPTSTNAAPFASPGSAGGPPRPVPIEASVIVLLYHQFRAAGAHSSNPWNMPVDVFESEMKYLKDNGYHVVSLYDMLRFLKGEIGLPPNSVVITIDDGYKSAIVYADPVLKKYGYPWTFFIYPDFITVNEGSGAASWKDLLALQDEGVDIESHSMTHPMLTKHKQKVKGVWHDFTPAEYDQWLTNETLGSKTLLEQKMGKTITCFAYPYGDYNKEVEAKAIAAGYQAIFTVADNPVHQTTNKFSIGRYTMTQEVEKNFAAYLRQGALGIAEADPAPGATISNPRPVITAVLGYAGDIDPNSIETSVRDYGVVKHDYDAKTSTIRLYLPRDLIQPVNLVNIRLKDAATGQVMVANWHFNFEPAAGANGAVHAPIAPATNAAATNAPTAAPKPTAPTTPAPTNSPATSQPQAKSSPVAHRPSA